MPKTSSASPVRVMIFVILVLAFGNLAGLNYYAADGLGGLLFILSPVLVTLGMRTFTQDGWTDSGLRMRLGQTQCLLFAFLIFPIIFFCVLASGSLLAQVQFGSDALQRLAIASLTSIPVIFLYATSEEFAWRGYLEPKLAALGMADIPRHLLVGVIWASWHTGYVLAGVNKSALPSVLYMVLFLLACIAMSVIYGQWRAKTNSFWPAAIAHGMANGLAWPLLNPELVQVHTPLWFAPRPEGLVALAALSLIALLVYKRRADS